MFKALAASTIISSIASGTAAVAGVITAISVVADKPSKTAGAVTLGATGVAVVGTLATFAATRRLIKKVDESMTAEAKDDAAA